MISAKKAKELSVANVGYNLKYIKEIESLINDAVACAKYSIEYQCLNQDARKFIINELKDNGYSVWGKGNKSLRLVIKWDDEDGDEEVP